MFGKKFSEYIHFDRLVIILIAAVFLARLVVGIAGMDITVTRTISINIALLMGLIYCSVNVHLGGFGSYKQLFGLLLVQTVFAHLLIACAILVAVATGVNNIYTVPEFFNGNDGRNLFHVSLHLIAGPMLAAIAWVIGSLILFVMRTLKPAR